MLFRIWFLYLTKVGLLGFVLVAVGFASVGIWLQATLLQRVGLWICMPLAIAGALLGLAMLVKKRPACPLCGASGDFVLYGKKPAIECESCGLVYCKSPSLSFKLQVEPSPGDESDDRKS